MTKFVSGGVGVDAIALYEQGAVGDMGWGLAIQSIVTHYIQGYGTEEQKQKFLAPMLRGEKLNWQRLTEPHSGADLADVQGKAVRDGDDWLLTGENVFISCYGDEDWYPGVMVTDPDAPRHRNLGFFMVPNHVPGIEVKPMDLLPGHGQKNIIMDNVRVPADHMIGGDHQGWQVMQLSLIHI